MDINWGFHLLPLSSQYLHHRCRSLGCTVQWNIETHQAHTWLRTFECVVSVGGKKGKGEREGKRMGGEKGGRGRGELEGE